MSKSFALAAFNTAVAITNGAHTVKRCAVKAAEVTATQSKATATASKEAGVAFWAGMKYAHQYNKARGEVAERLTPEDIAASKPSTKRNVRIVPKPSTKR